MYNPKDILTETGYKRHYLNVCNIERALFDILNDADDLHIGALDETQLDALYAVYDMVKGDEPLLLTGDGETYDD